MDPPPAWRGEDDLPPPDYPADGSSSISTPCFASSNNAGSGLPHLTPSVQGATSTTSGQALAVESDLSQDSFFDIAPSADATSFQAGYLGLPGFRAWIKGDVLVKLDQATRASRKFAKWCACFHRF